MTVLHLTKEDFKFSAAHFLIFDEKRAEKLHGHNFHVTVDLKVKSDCDYSNKGYLKEFRFFREEIKHRLFQWHEVLLLPTERSDLKIKESERSYEVTYSDRYYIFPRNEVVLLPVNNISVENLSYILAKDFMEMFKEYGISSVVVNVSEVPGQGASTEYP